MAHFMRKEFEQNEQGLLTAEQEEFLWQQFKRQSIALIILICLFIILPLEDIGWLFNLLLVGISSFFLIRTIYTYGYELILHIPPRLRVGYTQKYHNRHGLYIIIHDIHVKAREEEWSEIKNWQKYEIYYTEESKWLLSSRLVEK